LKQVYLTEYQLFKQNIFTEFLMFLDHFFFNASPLMQRPNFLHFLAIAATFVIVRAYVVILPPET